jgi:Cd2+/Zn2+-exporting ATPase
MTLMVAASPCALIISTPASILSGIGNAARRGILFKGGVHLEQAAGIQVVALDKTGTLTAGTPQVSDVVVMPGSKSDAPGADPAAERGADPAGEQQADPAAEREWQALWHGDEEELLALVATVEANSEHLLARASVEEAQRRNLAVDESIAFEAVSGRGVRAVVDGRRILIGNTSFVADTGPTNMDAATEPLARLEAENKTVVLVAEESDAARGTVILGIVAFSDQLRPEAADVVQDLKSSGVQRVVMLTGDNEETARRIGAEVGIDEVYAGLMPDEKLGVIETLEERYGTVAMVGDGVNDAPALARASLGIAMGAAGTDVAMETADVVLMADELPKVAYAIALSRRTRRTLIFNLGLAGLLIAVMIAGIFAVQLPLPLAVVGHEGGTVLVSLNGLRLLFFKRSSRSAPPRSAPALDAE